MKALILLFNLVLAGLTSCQSVVAQPTPATSNKHSNIEIEKMVGAYKAAPHRDVAPPANLQQQFTKDFPNARDIDWETGADVYKVEFEIGFITDYEAYYDTNANLLMYTVDLRESELPVIVKNAAMSKYPNYEFDDARKTVKGTETFYKVEMEKKHAADIKATYKPDGTFIKEIYD
jgi:hypothetical protein